MRADPVLELLRDYESRNVTHIAPDRSWPIVWKRAKGVRVWDAEERPYLDLTAAFGVAAAGHANPKVVAAARRQLGLLPHAMGDVHPHEGKARLARELSRITFERWAQAMPGPRSKKLLTAKTIFCNSGFEAVEAALKTALLASGKPGIIAFTGAYHGLGYGTLVATHREFFRHPFRSQLGAFGHFVPYPTLGDRAETSLPAIESAIHHLCAKFPIGAILVEPVQGRGGIHIPPAEFLPMLRRLCDEHEALLILDEVFTGLGRTGRWFACEHTGTVPDLICLGKALTGGFPLSACVGKAKIMDAWPPNEGEALHTSTFLGNPVGCAMALAQISEIQRRGLVSHSAQVGVQLIEMLRSLQLHPALRCSVRGLGLMAGLELRHPNGAPAGRVAFQIVKSMLRAGYIIIPEGEFGQVLSFTPPLIITARQLDPAVHALGRILARTDSP